MTAHPDDLLRRADVVAWLRGEHEDFERAADAIEAGAVAAAPPMMQVDAATGQASIVREGDLATLNEAIADARTLACAIADGMESDGNPCPVCGNRMHAPGCIVVGWSHRRDDGSLR